MAPWSIAYEQWDAVPYNSAYSYNFNPVNYMQREDQSIGRILAHYDINKMAEV